MKLPPPPELCRQVYDFIHPARVFQKFVEAIRERDYLLGEMTEPPSRLYDLYELQYADEEINTSYLQDMCEELERGSQNLVRLQTVTQHIQQFYRENPKFVRPVHIDDELILYDTLVLIMTQGDILDLRYHCEINGVEIPAKLQQQPKDEDETTEFRRELVKIVQGF